MCVGQQFEGENCQGVRVIAAWRSGESGPIGIGLVPPIMFGGVAGHVCPALVDRKPRKDRGRDRRTTKCVGGQFPYKADFRNSAFAMVRTWTSSGPSKIRIARCHPYIAARGTSSLTPAPPWT